MSKVLEVEKLGWEPVRPKDSEGIWGKTVLDGPVKVALTRVVPNGKFRTHRDAWGHLFYFLSGEGVVWVDARQIEAHPGVIVQIAPGEAHAYENTGTEDLVLLSLNLPPEG